MDLNFVAIPRTGSTSIASALGVRLEHKRASEVPGPRFSVVRHPAERARSAYRLALTNPYSLARECLGDARTFREFLLRDNLLTWPQSYWLDAPVELVLRFEDLPVAFEARFGVALPVVNETTPICKHDAETRALVIARYAEDFERFGYVAAA